MHTGGWCRYRRKRYRALPVKGQTDMPSGSRVHVWSSCAFCTLSSRPRQKGEEGFSTQSAHAVRRELQSRPAELKTTTVVGGTKVQPAEGKGSKERIKKNRGGDFFPHPDFRFFSLSGGRIYTASSALSFCSAFSASISFGFQSMPAQLFAVPISGTPEAFTCRNSCIL